MHRFYLPPGHWETTAPILRGGEAHHALTVLRLRRGERVTVLDGAGLECLCEVQDYDRDQVWLRSVERRLHPPRPWELTLCQALPKGKLIESLIQKATELGVGRVVPLLSERVVAALDEEGARQKQVKWQTVAIEALKQCGSPWLPKVEAPVALREFLARKEAFDLSLVGSLQPGSRHPREWFLASAHEPGRGPRSLCVFIGPEGDFAPAELDAIQAAGAKPVTLGPLVLRSETAAIYCLSVLSYEMQWLWTPGGGR